MLLFICCGIWNVFTLLLRRGLCGLLAYLAPALIRVSVEREMVLKYLVLSNATFNHVTRLSLLITSV